MTAKNEASAEGTVMTQSVVLTGKGSFNDVKVLDWPLPVQCKNDEIKVAVEYCGINFADVYHVFGRLIERPAPYVLGLECVGKIVELGSDVKDYKIGERVVCYKPDAGLLRDTVIVTQNECHSVPQDISSETACALLANYLTAYFALIKFGNLQQGQSVLIHSAAGGVGWAATQLASRVVTSVTVLGTSCSSKHTEIAANGITTPLTYANYSDHIPKSGVDVVIDNIGGENLMKSIDLVNPLGRVIVTGANSVVQEDKVSADEAMKALATSSSIPLQNLVMGNKAVCGLHLGTLLGSSPLVARHAVQYIFSLAQQALIEPRIHAIFPFNQTVDAIKTLAERKNIGKVLIKVK